MATDKKKLPPEVIKAFGAHSVQEPYQSIILEFVAPDKVFSFLEHITKVERPIFNALFIEGTKKEIRESFKKVWNEKLQNEFGIGEEEEEDNEEEEEKEEESGTE
jgi:hypothetical protein